MPDPVRFPNGLNTVVEYAKEKGVKLGLWFTPNRKEDYVLWEREADIINGLYDQYGIKYFKVDGVNIPTKRAEINFRGFLDSVLHHSNGEVVINLDLTNEKRPGYFYFYEYGNVFLENRYVDWGNYYPHWTLRNLWHLSKYYPAENLQIEFLNNERQKDKYPADDIFAPANIPFDYTFAITMMSQPLAWFEATNLNEEQAKLLSPILEEYNRARADIHSGHIFPIGGEPSGSSWTGFQSIVDEKSGYILVLRENNENSTTEMVTWLPSNKQVRFEKVLGTGNSFNATTGDNSSVGFSLPDVNNYALYKYVVD